MAWTRVASLADLRATTEELLASGAAIGEVNAVRKHLSAVKGGGLAGAAAPAPVLGLVNLAALETGSFWIAQFLDFELVQLRVY